MIASVVFLAIAAVVGSGRRQRRGRAGRRATEREREARLLALPVEQAAVRRRARPRARRVRRRCCWTRSGWRSAGPGGARRPRDERDRAARGRRARAARREIVPVVVASVPLGTLTTERPARRGRSRGASSELLEAATRQAAVGAGPRPAGRARAAGPARRRDQPAARGDVLLGHARPAHAARVDQGGRHEPARRLDRARRRRSSASSCTTILEETDRLNRLVGNILDLARIRAGALIPRRGADRRRGGRRGGGRADAAPARRACGSSCRCPTSSPRSRPTRCSSTRCSPTSWRTPRATRRRTATVRIHRRA